MTDINDIRSEAQRWTIWHTPATTPGTHESYVDGPPAGDWAGNGVEVVAAAEYDRLLAELAPHREREADRRSADRWSDAY